MPNYDILNKNWHVCFYIQPFWGPPVPLGSGFLPTKAHFGYNKHCSASNFGLKNAVPSSEYQDIWKFCFFLEAVIKTNEQISKLLFSAVAVSSITKKLCPSPAEPVLFFYSPAIIKKVFVAFRSSGVWEHFHKTAVIAFWADVL